MSVLERFLRRDVGVDLSITPMRRRDLRAGVLDIEAEAYPVGWSHGVFMSELGQVKSGSRYYVVARAGREIVGYAGLWFAVDEAHITNVAVAPDHRRRGVGRALLLHLADAAIERGCASWTLEVRVTSVGAQRMYESFGFESVGIRQKYYDNVVDAIVMWCHNIQSPEYRQRVERIREASHD